VRIYETIYICPPNITDSQMDEFSDLVREIIYDNGGKIIKQENWGRKRLAYEIQKFSEGYYFYFLYGGEKVNIDELERRLRYSDECIRFLTVRLDKELKGKKHKIFTQDELRLALQMESPNSTNRKSSSNGSKPEAEKAAEETGSEEPKVAAETSKEDASVAAAAAEAETKEAPAEESAKESE
jgi:small subunit ribosomal protein S6